jgi:DNA-binding transcriptional LysR family regulator
VSPDLHKLRHFVAVAEDLNFTRAAERLHMAQQALSGSIRRLEQELGVELLVRSTRHVELTAAGRALLEEGRVLLANSQATWDGVRRIGRGETTLLRIGFRQVFPREYVDLVIADWRTTHPDTEVLASEHPPDELLAKLTSGELDVALCFVTAAPGLSATVLGGKPLTLAVDADHPFASRGQIAMTELAAQPLVIWNSQNGSEFADYREHTDLLRFFCRRAGFEPRFEMRPYEAGLEAAIVGTPFATFTFAPPGPALEGRAMVVEVRPEPRMPLRAVTARMSPLINDFLVDGAKVMPSLEAPGASAGQSAYLERLAGERLSVGGHQERD